MSGKQRDNVCMGCSRKNACFALWFMGWMGLRRNGDLNRYGLGLIDGDRFVDGGEKAGGVVGAVGVGSNCLAW